MRRLPLLGSILLLATACGSPPPVESPVGPSASTGQSAAPKSVDDLDRPLPLDARVTKGKLANGLTYYVMPHRKP